MHVIKSINRQSNRIRFTCTVCCAHVCLECSQYSIEAYHVVVDDYSGISSSLVKDVVWVQNEQPELQLICICKVSSTGLRCRARCVQLEVEGCSQNGRTINSIAGSCCVVAPLNMDAHESVTPVRCECLSHIQMILIINYNNMTSISILH